MIIALILLLAVLWILGYLPVGFTTLPEMALFSVNGEVISLWDIIIFALILWAIGILSTPLRQIAGVVLVLWVLSEVNVIAFPGLASILVIAVIVGLVASLFMGKRGS